MLFDQGRSYVAFVDKPFVVSADALATAGTAKGFDSVLVMTKDDAGGSPFLASFLPLAPSSGWNTIAFGRWSQAQQSIDLPSQVAKVADVTDQANASPSAPAPSSSAPGLLTVEQCGAPWRRFTLVATLMALAVGGGVGWYVGKRSKAA